MHIGEDPFFYIQYSSGIDPFQYFYIIKNQKNRCHSGTCFSNYLKKGLVFFSSRIVVTGP
jgi:hypothetical protein